jgi:hypothetical protein
MLGQREVLIALQKTLLRTHPNHHRLSRLPRLVVPHDNPDKLQTAPRNRKADRRLKIWEGGGFRIADGPPVRWTAYGAQPHDAVSKFIGSRGYFQPRVPGGEWSHGAMGNARWTGGAS